MKYDIDKDHRCAQRRCSLSCACTGHIVKLRRCKAVPTQMDKDHLSFPAPYPFVVLFIYIALIIAIL